ncbi:MAG: NAD(+)/NADH kinase [Rickettsiales bacterium]|jgi:NAD+ kinase|nr:NAD(+)/NADH kinase [Rickettsiales bacterium]
MKFGIICTRNTPKTENFSRLLAENYGATRVLTHTDAASSDVLVVLGGDGSMLRAVRNFYECGVPFYGINCGTIGFLLNEFNEIENMVDAVTTGVPLEINPMAAEIIDETGLKYEDIFINEICLFRGVFRPCSIDLKINSRERIKNYSGDGILVSTAIGSTAYNSSVGGIIVPPKTHCLSVAAINPNGKCCFRNAIVDDSSFFEFRTNNSSDKVVNAFVDGREYKNVSQLRLWSDRQRTIELIFNSHLSLEEKILNRQFQ